MKRWWVGGALALTLGCGNGKPKIPPPPPPNGYNIIFIVVDTLRADHLETYGYALGNSSRLYTFGKHSVTFHNAYAQSAWTKPSVASLLTSLEPRDHGINDWEQQMTDDKLTITEVLKRAGYETEAYIGHHALEPKYNNFHQGFDVFDISAFENWGSPHKIASAGRLSNLAIKAIKKERDNPYFMWLHYFDPHDDYLSHKRFDYGPLDQHRYDSEIAYTDHHLGRIFATLRDNKKYEDTIVVVTADHGEEFLDHGHTRHTHQMYEEVIRVPLMIRAPGLEPSRVDVPVAGIDIAPTMLRLVGVDVPPRFKGRALPVIDDTFYVDADHPVFSETRREVDRQAVILRGWKLIEDKYKKTYQLYDLKLDPKERFNQYKKRPRKAAELQAILTEHFHDPVAPAPAMEPDDEFTDLLEQLGYVDGDKEAGEEH